MTNSSLVILLVLCNFTFAQKYTIIRQVKDALSGVIQPDLVQIPPSLCHDNGTKECPLMDGQKHSMCQCVCDEKDDNLRLYKSTFGFYNATWKCVQNAAIQRYSGCLFSMDGAGEKRSVTLPSNITVRHSLSNVTTGLYTSVEVGTTCSPRAESSTYLKCDGNWEQLNPTIVNKRFHTSYPEPTNGKHFVYFWINSTEHLSHPLPPGRIIRVGVTCSDRPWESSQCILMKIQGELECPVPIFTSRTTQPSSPHSTKVTFPSSTKSTTVTVTSTTVPNVNSSDDDSGTVFSATLIGVALGGIAVLLVLVVVIVLIANRQTKRDRERRKNSTAPIVQDIKNESYEDDISTSVDHTYMNVDPKMDHTYMNVDPKMDHTYINVDPKAVSPTAASTAQARPHAIIPGDRNSVTNMAYDKVEVFGRPNVSTIQDNLKEQQNLPGTRKQSVYVIPEHENKKNEHNYNEDRDSYDVLERPTRHDALSNTKSPCV